MSSIEDRNQTAEFDPPPYSARPFPSTQTQAASTSAPRIPLETRPSANADHTSSFHDTVHSSESWTGPSRPRQSMRKNAFDFKAATVAWNTNAEAPEQDALGLTPSQSSHHEYDHDAPIFRIPEPPSGYDVLNHPLRPVNIHSGFDKSFSPLPTSNQAFAYGPPLATQTNNGLHHSSTFNTLPGGDVSRRLRELCEQAGSTTSLLERLPKETKRSLETMLENYDTVFVVDDSTSMVSENRWPVARHALATVAAVAAELDEDGIDIHFFNSPACGTRIKDSRDALAIFDSVTPRRGTPTDIKLKELWTEYNAKLMAAEDTHDDRVVDSVKPINVIVITDGRPNSFRHLKDLITNMARDLRARDLEHKVGLQFIQVGNDEVARDYLKKLDNKIEGNGIPDIVDTTRFSRKSGELDADKLLKALAGGIDRRIDREEREGLGGALHRGKKTLKRWLRF